MRINLSDDKLILTFKYNPQILSVIRSIPGRRFNLNKKRWEVPIENAAECVDLLIPLGFTPTLDVKRLVDFQKRQEGIAEEIKNPSDEARLEIPIYKGNLPLFNFQKTGVSFLKTIPNVLLADAPGLGKTIQTIAATEKLKMKLVFCPASLKYSWAEEIKKWSPNESISVINGSKEQRHSQWQGLSNWMIANYELLLHDYDDIIKHQSKYGFKDIIIADEATRISNHAAKTTKALKCLSSKKRVALTGTPISNRPDDIWSIIDWISPRYLGSYYQFTQQYCIREPRFNRIVGYKNLSELGGRIGRFMIRRTKEEVLKDLPPKIIETISFELSEKERKLYLGVRNLIASEILKLEVNPLTLNLIPVKMLRLKQAVNHPSLITGRVEQSSKLETLKDIIAPIAASDEKTIVFTQFAEMAKILLSELNIYEPRIIMGEVPAEDRQKAVNEFTMDPKCKVMISTEAGAYGLNLQSASYVVHYDLPWSVAKLQQREDRAHRIGQTKSVTVYNLIAKNTIDEYVARVLHKKQKISVDVLKDDERLEDIGLSDDDIKAILRI